MLFMKRHGEAEEDEGGYDCPELHDEDSSDFLEICEAYDVAACTAKGLSLFLWRALEPPSTP